MKYSNHQYAKALTAALAEPKADEAAIGKHFLALVRRQGDEARLAKILEEASRLARRAGRAREVVIESARPLTAAQKKLVHAFVKPHDTVREKIDPRLVAGVKIIVNDEEQFDGTMKAKLDTIFLRNQ